MAVTTAVKGKLIAVIGDEVGKTQKNAFVFK